MKELRLFIAVAPSESAHRAILAVQTTLRTRLGDEAVRWVREANLHVTLHFLGSTDPADVDRIVGAMRSVARASSGAIPLALVSPGAFPNTRRARTLWVGVDDPDGGLARIERRLRDELRAGGFESEERPFRPHVTIGYLRKRARAGERSEAGAALEGVHVPRISFAADEIVLMESVLQAGGSRYTRLESIGLTR